MSVPARRSQYNAAHKHRDKRGKRRPESEWKAPVTVIKMSEGQGRHGDWDKGVGGEQEGDTLGAICVHVYVCLSCGERG